MFGVIASAISRQPSGVLAASRDILSTGGHKETSRDRHDGYKEQHKCEKVLLAVPE